MFEDIETDGEPYGLKSYEKECIENEDAMTLNDLIERLQQYTDQYGDLPVYTNGGDSGAGYFEMIDHIDIEDAQDADLEGRVFIGKLTW